MKLCVKPILLSTNLNNGTLYTNNVTGKLSLDSLVNRISEKVTAHHLYILDETSPIKQGDWWMKLSSRTNLYLAPMMLQTPISNITDEDPTLWVKVIATTDPAYISYGIPPVSKTFLNDFVICNGIGKVKVEMYCVCSCPGFPLNDSCQQRNDCLAVKLDPNKNVILTIESVSERTIYTHPEDNEKHLDGIISKVDELIALLDKKIQLPVDKAAQIYGKAYIGNTLYLRSLAVNAFKAGWNANPAKWSDGDLKNAFNGGVILGKVYAEHKSFDEWLQNYIK